MNLSQFELNEAEEEELNAIDDRPTAIVVALYQLCLFDVREKDKSSDGTYDSD